MKNFDYHKKLEQLTDKDFLPGLFDSFQIWIQKYKESAKKRYLDIGFSSYESAESEVDRIKCENEKRGISIYSIEIKPTKVRRLKKPLSVS